MKVISPIAKHGGTVSSRGYSGIRRAWPAWSQDQAGGPGVPGAFCLGGPVLPVQASVLAQGTGRGGQPSAWGL